MPQCIDCKIMMMEPLPNGMCGICYEKHLEKRVKDLEDGLKLFRVLCEISEDLLDRQKVIENIDHILKENK